MFAIETERLRLREWQEGDWEALRRMHNDPEVMRYLGGELLTDEQIQDIERRMIVCYAEHGYCYWLVEVKDTGESVGLCGVQYKADEDYYDFGWRLAREHWNHGYISEAARAVKQHMFETIRIPKLTSTARRENIPSINVMKKMGMQFVEEYDSPYGICVRYELDNPHLD